MNEHDLYRMMKDIDRKYTDELHQYAAELAATKRRRTMKQNTKKGVSAAQIILRKIGVGAAVAACAAIAVFIGAGIISMDKQQQMQVGMSGGTSVAEQLSENEPILIRNNCTEGVALAMDIPAEGTAKVLHSVEDAEPWITLLQQNAENGSEFGAGYSPMLEMLNLETQYQDYDLIFAAVPYHYFSPRQGITEHNFMGGTITPDGKLTVEAGFVRVSDGLRTLMLPEIETFCCCFAVPKDSVPEITDFAFSDVFYDCTDPLPDDVRTQGEQGEFLCSLPQHQEYSKMTGKEKYLYWVEDDIQTAEESQSESIPPEGCTEVQEISAEHTTHTTVSSRNITKTAQIEELEEPQNEHNSAEDTTISMMIPENTDTESSEIIGDFDLDGRITPADYAWADLILYAELENIIDELPLNEEQMRQCELIPNDTTMSPLGEEEYKAIQNAGKLCWWGITNALDFRAYLDNQEYYNKLLHEYIPPELHPQSDDDNFTVLVRKIQRYTADSCMKRYGNQGWWSTANFEGFPIASLDEILVELEAAKDWKVGYYS